MLDLGMLIWIGVGLVLFAIFLFFAFVSASPGEVKVISGPRGQRVLHGKTGWKVPLLERVDTMTAEMISVDAKTTDFVPTNDYINVKVDAAVKVKIATDDSVQFQAATRNFLYKDATAIADEVRDTLEGHLRAIIGQMKLEEIVTDRTTFSEKVQANAKQDLEEMGLQIVAFNIQGLVDQNGVIKDLGIDNTEQIKKRAAIAKAVAQREVAEAQAKADREANDSRVQADLDIAEKQNDLVKRKAALQVESDREKAKADAAYSIQEEIQRKEIEREKAQADIIKQEQTALVKQQEVKVKEESLKAEIKAKADADRYAAEQKASAELFEKQREADAEAYERTQKAKAEKEALIAEAEGIKAKGLAEAEAIRAKLEAEAIGLDKKAEAMKKYGEAAVIEMLVNALPEIAKNVAEPLKNVDSITMYGEGNSGKMVGDIMTSMNQVTSGLGLDVRNLITATLTGRAMANGIQQSQESAELTVEPTVKVEDSIPEWLEKPTEDVDFTEYSSKPSKR